VDDCALSPPEPVAATVVVVVVVAFVLVAPVVPATVLPPLPLVPAGLGFSVRTSDEPISPLHPMNTGANANEMDQTMRRTFIGDLLGYVELRAADGVSAGWSLAQ
jgi:hypothetical protein